MKHNIPHHRSDEPVYWLLFGAGGMVLGMVFPAVLILLIVAGIMQPDLNEGLLSFAHAKSMLGNWLSSLAIFVCLSLVAWHCVHRIFHSLHDLRLPATKLVWFALYGLAACVTFAALGLQLLIYCKLF